MMVLDDVEDHLARFVSYPSEHARIAHVLWIAHAHLVECFENTPRLAFLSPEPGSGKTRALEVTEPLVPRPVITVNATPSYVFRKISDPDGLPTLLFDEVDAIFSSRRGDGNEDLRGLLNSGYRRGATAGRAVVRGKEIVTEDWPSFAPVALAGLNQLPDTLMTRSVVIRMKRRLRGERLEPYRRRVEAVRNNELYVAVAEWSRTVWSIIEDSWPELPPGIEDRDADIWEPLLSVADAAGGEWPARARTAAQFLVDEAHDRPVTLGIRLLADIRQVMGDDDRIATTDLLDRLHGLDAAPWGNIKGEPIDARFLARTLAKYDVPTNNTFRINDRTVKGYRLTDLHDAFERYVPSPEIGNSGNTSNPEATIGPKVTDVTDVTETRREGATVIDLHPELGKLNCSTHGRIVDPVTHVCPKCWVIAH